MTVIMQIVAPFTPQEQEHQRHAERAGNPGRRGDRLLRCGRDRAVRSAGGNGLRITKESR